ncbi:hypothetical protein KIW84_023810 [Lathyrus oleraceus]|uniref:Uncharacterized protein n=1 Tax=Pisum sativum TaxID=3888 RepID=A0A9D4YDY4_PEA|nr:hypothetical protein KIW84_023810 [Pisum sativum]
MLWNISPSEKVSEKLVISGWNAASEAKVMFGELKGCPARMKWMLVFKGKSLVSFYMWMVVTRSVRGNHVELIEQWMGNMETSMEQIRQLVLDQQSRPQVTVDQIRQLIQEQQTRRHTRKGREDRRDDDDKGSAFNSESGESRPRHHYHNNNQRGKA